MINHSPDSGGSIVVRIHLHLVKDCDQNVALTGGLAEEDGYLFL